MWANDSLTGLLFAAWLYTLLHDKRASSHRAYGLVARGLAGMSYTLYVVHLPFLVFLRSALVPDTPWPPTPAPILVGVGIAGVALAYAWVVAALTESQTARVRRSIAAWLGRVHPVRVATLGSSETRS